MGQKLEELKVTISDVSLEAGLGNQRILEDRRISILPGLVQYQPAAQEGWMTYCDLESLMMNISICLLTHNITKYLQSAAAVFVNLAVQQPPTQGLLCPVERFIKKSCF